MSPDNAPKSLSEIAGELGLNMSDVAMFSGLDESTVSRLWDNTGWLDRISGRSLQSLMSSIPGIAEYSMAHSLRRRRDTLLTDLHDAGLSVDVRALARAPVAQQYVLNALEAALHIMRGNSGQRVSSYLARFWGREPDAALSVLYSTEPGEGLLVDQRPLVESSVELAPRLNRKSYSFHSILALNILTHQVSKVTRVLDTDLDPQSAGRQSAFMIRGVVMGVLISSGDLELAEKYHRKLETTPVFAALEEWSFPTYTRDGRITSDFTLPSSLLLQNTAREILREIAAYNDAYVYYLVSTYIPLGLQRDPTFGGRVGDLIKALERRAERCTERRVRDACGQLVERLRGIA
jgi:hypothetical protein